MSLEGIAGVRAMDRLSLTHQQYRPDLVAANARLQYDESERRLRVARNQRGLVALRIPPYVQFGKPKYRFYALCGQALLMRVPEVIDVWDLLRDLKRFLQAWRPMRLRSPAERLEAREVLERWDRLADALGRDGRWQLPPRAKPGPKPGLR